MKLQYWDRQQIRTFVREVRQDIGPEGWALLVDRIRKALIEQKVLGITLTQLHSAANVQVPGAAPSAVDMKLAIIELRNEMLKEAGLFSDED